MNDETLRAGVLAASPSELGTMRQAGLILEKFGVGHEIRIMSSSRNPDLVDEYARTAFERGLKVVICSTGMSGHLAAAVAARTILPVIGVPIEGLDDAAAIEGATVFHAGTESRGDTVMTAGGRVLAVTGVGGTIEEARWTAYAATDRIMFEGKTYRRDIAAAAAIS